MEIYIYIFFNELTETLNEGIEEFKKEMDNQGRWKDVRIVMVSEFARTLPENSRAGSDHGKLSLNAFVHFTTILFPHC